MEDETKILVWNLQRFSINKFVHQNDPRYIMQYNRMLSQTKRLNGRHLIQTVTTMDPDIFVVIEVQSSQGIYGSLVNGSGAQGLLALLRELRAVDDDWDLVPALRLNSNIDLRRGEVLTNTYTEGIGVFFKRSRLQFQGPWIWPDRLVDYTYRAVQQGYQGAQPALYPDVWQDCLRDPASRRLAGRYLFSDPEGNPADFTEWWHRQPFLTTFRELGRAVNRTINLTSVHLTPTNTVSAKNALYRIRACVPGYRTVPANTVSIIAGDFNINRNNAATNANLLVRTATVEDNWLLGPGPSTMYQPIDEATTDDYQRNELLDNAIIFYPAGVNANPRPGLIADIANGSLADDDLPAVPQTMPRSPMALQTYLENWHMAPARIQAIFRSPENFGHIGPSRGLSDHLPFYFTV